METLLLVDDDVSLLESLTLHFEDAEKDGHPRFHVVTATTAAAGLEKARDHAPALVVLDMMLPDRPPPRPGWRRPATTRPRWWCWT